MMPLPPPARKRCSGFSVLEVMLMVTLLALFAAISVPTWRGFFGVSLEQEAARLQSVLQLLRQEAVLNRTAYWLVLEIKKNRYRIEMVDDEGKRKVHNRPSTMRPYHLSANLKVVQVLSGGPAQDDGEASVRVDSLGFADPFVWNLQTPKGERSLQSSILAEIKVSEGHVELTP